MIGQMVVRKVALTAGSGGGNPEAAVQCLSGEKLISGGVGFDIAAASRSAEALRDRPSLH